MAYTTVYKDIVFVEGNNSKALRKEEINANLMGIGAQLKSLNNVKDNMVDQAKSKGYNCILDFKYGQKTALFAFDDIKFYGSGIGAILPEEDYDEIIKKKCK